MGTSEGVRPLRGFQADHSVSSAWRGHRPRFTRPVLLVISNRSGSGAAADVGRRLARELSKRGYRIRVRVADAWSEGRARLARDAADAACLLGVGGDYTLSQLAGVAREAQVPLVPVPCGFGNIFARAFGIRPTVSAVTDILERGRVGLVDVGVWDDSLFLSNQGFGFLEEVQTRVEMSGTLPRQRWRRYARYIVAAARSAAGPLPAVAVDLDGVPIAERTPIVIVANVPTYGTFLPLVTDASPFDGLLDVMVAPAMSKGRLLAWLLGILVGAPGCRRALVSRRASRITITAAHRTDEIVVMPHAVSILLPWPRASLRASSGASSASPFGAA